MAPQNEKLVAWAQIIASLAAIGSFIVAYQTLKLSVNDSQQRRRENEQAMEQRESPFLAFDRMSNVVNLQFVEGPKWSVDIQRDAQGTITDHPLFPTIRNYGVGPAINCSVEIVITEIDGQRVDPQTTKIMTSPLSILPDGIARAFVLPDCISHDKDKKIRTAKGSVRLNCERVSGKTASFEQRLDIQTGYLGKPPNIYFGVEFPTKLKPLGMKVD